MKEKEELMKVTNKLNIIALHQAKIALTIKHENEIFDFILYNRALGNIVTSSQIIYKLWSINDKYMEKSWSSLQKWCYRFIHRNYLNFRRSTHISLKLAENCLNRMQEYYNIKFRGKYDFELNAIANMDETPLYFSMPPCTTVQKIGSKKVKNINTKTRKLKRNNYFLLFLLLDKNCYLY